MFRNYKSNFTHATYLTQKNSNTDNLFCSIIKVFYISNRYVLNYTDGAEVREI